MENWKKKTCENCGFRIGSLCRRFPPCLGAYTNVKYETKAKKENGESLMVYFSACAEYKEVK
jgi:hypothetical protein